MQITSGKHSGKTGRLMSFANTWIAVDVEDGPPNAIVKPTQVKLNEDEIATVRAANAKDAGIFWDLWRLEEDGTFVGADHGRPITLGVTARLGKRRSARRNRP